MLHSKLKVVSLTRYVLLLFMTTELTKRDYGNHFNDNDEDVSIGYQLRTDGDDVDYNGDTKNDNSADDNDEEPLTMTNQERQQCRQYRQGAANNDKEDPSRTMLNGDEGGT